jgi:hypothetical protein
MKNKRRLKKLCTEFVVLNDVAKDHILGISKALAFAVQKPNSDKKDEVRVTEYEMKP